MNPSVYLYVLACLLEWLHPNPRQVSRLVELETIAADIARALPIGEEARDLAAIAIHETGAVIPHHAGDGGKAFGPFQVRGSGDHSAKRALAIYRWSMQACGDMSLYAGCGRCGACPEIAASLLDPTLPRR